MIKIKDKFKNVIIGFNNSGKPLGERTDLHILYDMAKSHKRQDYLDMFEPIEETEAEKEKRFNEKQKRKHTDKQQD